MVAAWDSAVRVLAKGELAEREGRAAEGMARVAEGTAAAQAETAMEVAKEAAAVSVVAVEAAVAALGVMETAATRQGGWLRQHRKKRRWQKPGLDCWRGCQSPTRIPRPATTRSRRRRHRRLSCSERLAHEWRSAPSALVSLERACAPTLQLRPARV